MKDKRVVTAFLRYNGNILLLKRSDAVGTYRGRWAAVSGFLEESTPLAQARREIREETTLTDSDIRLVKAGHPLVFMDPDLGIRWTVHPLLFDIRDPSGIRLDWENKEMRWVEPGALADFQTVPGLAEALGACLETDR